MECMVPPGTQYLHQHTGRGSAWFPDLIQLVWGITSCCTAAWVGVVGGSGGGDVETAGAMTGGRDV